MFLLHSSMFVCLSIFVVVVVVVFVTLDCRVMGYNAFQTLFPALYFQSLFSNNFRHFSDPCFSYDKWSLRFYSCFQSTKSTHLARCKLSGFLALFFFWTEWPTPPLNKNSWTTENEKYQNFKLQFSGEYFLIIFT